MIGKFFVLSFRNLRHRNVRSWLTVLGIIVGVALIVSLVSLGKGLENGISQQLKMFGGDLLTIMPGEETDPLLGILGGDTIRDRDVDLLNDVSGVNLVVPFDMVYYQVEFKGEINATMIHGSPIEESKELYTENRGLGMEAGKWPERETTNELVLGYKIAKSQFRDEVFVGDEIRIKGKDFKVVGILKEIGSAEDDNAVYISLYNLRRITGRQGTVKMVLVRIAPGYDQNKVAEDIKFILRQERGSADFTVLTSEKTQAIVGDILGAIQLSVLFIAIFAILVGAIGVMNTMYTSVLERRREIGIMKAIGATDTDIMDIFIIESGVIGLIGGTIGIAIGLSLAKIAEIAAVKAGVKFLEVYISVQFILGVLAFAFLLGIISGVLPARQAARLKPAEALRYE